MLNNCPGHQGDTSFPGRLATRRMRMEALHTDASAISRYTARCGRTGLSLKLSLRAAKTGPPQPTWAKLLDPGKKTLRVLWPLNFIATRSGMPARTMFRMAVRRKSRGIPPGQPAAIRARHPEDATLEALRRTGVEPDLTQLPFRVAATAAARPRC